MTLESVSVESLGQVKDVTVKEVHMTAGSVQVLRPYTGQQSVLFGAEGKVPFKNAQLTSLESRIAALTVQTTQQSAECRAMTPCTALKAGQVTVLSQEALDAREIFRQTNNLPKISTKSAFCLIAYATQFSNTALREAAFKALCDSFQERKDLVVDYCQAIWLLAQEGEVSFLSSDKVEAIRKIQKNPFELGLAPWIKLSQKECSSLCEILGSRAKDDATNGLGTIRFSDLCALLENYKAPGSVFRVLLKDSSAVLSVVKTKDCHQFSMYMQYIKDGVCTLPYVRDYESGFCFKVSRIEIAQKQVEKHPVISEALNNRDDLSVVVKDSLKEEYSERSLNASRAYLTVVR